MTLSRIVLLSVSAQFPPTPGVIMSVAVVDRNEVLVLPPGVLHDSAACQCRPLVVDSMSLLCIGSISAV